MTREKAKELAEILQAYSEGKNIQFFESHDGWQDWSDNESEIFDDMDYRIKPEPKYVPFENSKEMYEAIRKHGAWVHLRFKDYEEYYAINTICKDGVLIGDDEDGNERCFDEMVKDFVWADDGTPCGKLI